MCKRALKPVWFLFLAGVCVPGLAAESAPPAPPPAAATHTPATQQFIYKWTDSQGMMKYSELPPPQGVKFEMVPKSATGIAGGSAPRDLDKDQQELARKMAEQEEQDRQQAEEAQKQQDEARVKNCEIARKNVQVLEGDTQVVRDDGKGNKVVLDAEQRAAELKRFKKDVDYFCDSTTAQEQESEASQEPPPVDASQQ